MYQFYSYFKAFHIIGFVTWFAGLFYLVRMFVYFAEVDTKPKELQERRYERLNSYGRFTDTKVGK